MLNHYFTINDHSSLNSSVMYQFGQVGNLISIIKTLIVLTLLTSENYLLQFTFLNAITVNFRAFTPDFENAEKSRLEF
jgi:uncharacterized membrane protein YwaF